MNPGGVSLEGYNKDNLRQNNSDSLKTIDITIKRLDDENINNISLIKLDVEGYELQVLECAIHTINKNKPIIVIEIWKDKYNTYVQYLNKTFPYYTINNINNDDYILIPK